MVNALDQKLNELTEFYDLNDIVDLFLDTDEDEQLELANLAIQDAIYRLRKNIQETYWIGKHRDDLHIGDKILFVYYDYSKEQWYAINLGLSYDGVRNEESED